MINGGDPVVTEGYITTAEGVELTGYHVEYLRYLARTGAIKAQKVTPRAWLINRQSLLDYQETVKMGRPRQEVAGDD